MTQAAFTNGIVNLLGRNETLENELDSTKMCVEKLSFEVELLKDLVGIEADDEKDKEIASLKQTIMEKDIEIAALKEQLGKAN